MYNFLKSYITIFCIKIPGFFSSKAYSYFDAYQTDVPLSTTGNFLIVYLIIKSCFFSLKVLLIIIHSFFLNLDHPGLAMKSTRNSDNYNNHIDGSITPSTILVHGLLGEVCISDNDCSILNSICDNFTKRCACKKGTVPDALEKVCKVAERVVPPTMLISKYLQYNMK